MLAPLFGRAVVRFCTIFRVKRVAVFGNAGGGKVRAREALVRSYSIATAYRGHDQVLKPVVTQSLTMNT